MMAGYPGSKGASGVAERIISLMPAHSTYLELFAGEGAVVRLKKPAARNLCMDLSPACVTTLRRILPPGIPVLQGDCLEWMLSGGEGGTLAPMLQDPSTLAYFDPPYLNITRTHQRLYTHEFLTEEEHVGLLLLLRRLPCMVMLSGYWSELYQTLLWDWRVDHFTGMTRGGPREEYVWMNFPAGLALHDVRFFGEGYRERERIKRKRDRWRAKLLAMDVGERQVILEALEEADAADVGLRPPPAPESEQKPQHPTGT